MIRKLFCSAAIVFAGSVLASTPGDLEYWCAQQPDGSYVEFTFRVWDDAYVEITGGSVRVPAVNCDIYDSIVIPSLLDHWPVRIIGDWAFAGLKHLKKVSIPTTVIHIGYGAFQGSGLETVTIPGSVWSIGSNYAYQSMLDSFYQFEEAESWVRSYCSDLYSGIIAQKTAWGESVTVDYWYDVMQSVISSYYVTGGAFADCKDLRSVVIEKSKMIIPYACQSGYELYSQFDVRSIGNRTFDSCENLVSVSLPDDLTRLGISVFHDCSSLAAFRVPAEMSAISGEAFIGCTSLSKFEVSEDNYDFFAWDGVLYSYSGEMLIKVPAACETLDAEAILEGVKEIGSYAFADCQQISDVSLPDEVNIANNVQIITNVSETVSFENSVSVNIWNTFASNVYSNVDALTHIGGDASSVSQETTSINESFGTNISVCISGSRTCSTYKSREFANNLEEYWWWYESTLEQLSSCGSSVYSNRYVGSFVSCAPVGIFLNCRNLRSVVLGEQCSMIQNEMFKGCSLLTNVSYRGPIRAIGNDAFSGCSSLTNIEIPEGVKQVGYGAFAGCRKLKEIVFPESLVALGNVSNWGKDINSEECTSVYVNSNTHWSLEWQLAVTSTKNATERVYNNSETNHSENWRVNLNSTCYYFSDSSWSENQTSVRSVLNRSGSAYDHGSCCVTDSFVLDLLQENGGSASILQTLRQVAGKNASHDETFNEFSSDLNITAMVKDRSEFKQTSVFIGCISLTNVIFRGNAPYRGRIAPDVFYGASAKTRVTIPLSACGWDDKYVYTTIPSDVCSNNLSAKEILSLFGNEIDYSYDSSKTILMYSASNRPLAVPREWFAKYGLEDIISKDSSVVAITSTVPESIVGMNLPRSLYESYVVGLDPTNETVQFSATIDFVDGKPIVSCTPELEPDEAALRKYTVYGKSNLSDENWSVVHDDCENYQFFKVSIEMR